MWTSRGFLGSPGQATGYLQSEDHDARRLGHPSPLLTFVYPAPKSNAAEEENKTNKTNQKREIISSLSPAISGWMSTARLSIHQLGYMRSGKNEGGIGSIWKTLSPLLPKALDHSRSMASGMVDPITES